MSEVVSFMDPAKPVIASRYSDDGILRSIYSNERSEIEWDMSDIVGLTVQLSAQFYVSCNAGSLRHADASTLGRAFLYAPGERAHIMVDGECRVLQLKLPRSEVDRLLLEDHDEPNGTGALRPLHGQTDFILLSQAMVEAGGVRDITIQTVVAALVDRYGSTRRVARRRGLSPATLRRVEDFVESDLPSVTLDSMAMVAGLSLYHFAREFLHETGQTPWTFVTERRVWFAMQLLLTGLSMDEAARAAGFAHSSHMGRAFHRQFGLAPSAARKRLLPIILIGESDNV